MASEKICIYDTAETLLWKCALRQQMLNVLPLKMDEIFSKKPWCQPVVVASSSGLSSRRSESEVNSVRETRSLGSPKSKKGTLATLLGKRLKQSEEHEKAKQKRHEERMQMDEKFLKVLEKLAEK